MEIWGLCWGLSDTQKNKAAVQSESRKFLKKLLVWLTAQVNCLPCIVGILC